MVFQMFVKQTKKRNYEIFSHNILSFPVLLRVLRVVTLHDPIVDPLKYDINRSNIQDFLNRDN